MASLTSCIRKAGEFLHADDKRAIYAAARELRSGGMSASDAAAKAVRDQIDAVRAMLSGAAPIAEAAPTAEKPRVFKTRKAAEAERDALGNEFKLQPIKGGFILRRKSEREMAAAELAGRRLAAGASGKRTLLQTIAYGGGLSLSDRADTIGEGNRNVGGKMLFTKDGKTIHQWAESLAESGFIPPGQDDDGVRWLQGAIQAEYAGQRTHYAMGDAESLEADLEARRLAAQGDEPLDEFGMDDLADAGYAAAAPEVQALTEAILAEAEALGVDPEAVKEDAARAAEGLSDDEYHAQAQRIARAAITAARQDAARGEPEGPGRGGEDRGAPAGDQGQAEVELSPVAPRRMSRAERDSFLGEFHHDGRVDNLHDAGDGNVHVVHVEDGTITAESEPVARAKVEQFGVYEAAGKTIRKYRPLAQPDEDPLLVAQSPDDLRAKADREEAARKADAAEQKRLENKAKADAERGDFALTGSNRAADLAVAQGQGDIFAAPVSPAAPAPAAGESVAQGESGKIEDFGAKILGARKDYAHAYGDKMALAETLDIAAEPLSKTWPEPDYAKIVEDGADPWRVAFAHAARDAVPTKPSKRWKLRGWVENVEMLRRLAKTALDGDVTTERLKAGLAASQVLADSFAGNVRLYEVFGHALSLKGTDLKHNTYTMIDGKYHPGGLKQWAIEQKAKATVFSNWPNELARADTMEAAIEAFRPKYAEMAAAQQQGESKPRAQVAFDIYSYRGKPSVWIGKKIGKETVDLKQFDSTAEARKYKAEHQAELERLLAEAKEVPPERRSENLPRIGKNHRDAGDVTPEQFAEDFGFRGVQFGNYVEGGKRQRDLNDAYDALMDLAGVIGIPPKALSLNGELGLAFGARGHGGKNAPSAHYEPVQVVINLTKESGAGSLAHEWFHAVDNYFSRARKEPLKYVTDRPDTRGEGVRPEMVAAFKQLMATIKLTGLAARSKVLDKTRSKPYWGTDLEMAARSFESYVIAKLQDQGAANDYLANIVAEDAYRKPEGYPYPTAAEAPQIRAAFDNFFNVVQTREDDAGNVALYSVAGDAAKAWIAVASNTDAFQYTASQSRDPRQIVIDSGAQVGIDPEPGKTGADVQAAWRVYPLGPNGKPDKTKTGYLIHYKDGKVELNVARFTEGDAGSAAYAVAGNYAHNNGLKFVGDRFGLSEAAVERRLENMLSLALKFGTTDFMRPAQEQLDALGLKWKDGAFEYNLRQMLAASFNAFKAKLPQIKEYTYDPDTDSITDHARGVELDDAGRADLVARARAAGVRAGRATVTRMVLTNTILQSKDGTARRQLLEGIGRVAGQPLGEDSVLAGLLYSHGTGATSPAALRAALEREMGAENVKALEDAGLLNLAELPSPSMPASAAGVTHPTGEIELFARNIPAGSTATAYHEALHATLRRTIGDTEFDALMDRLSKIGAAARKGSDVAAFFKAAVERIPADTRPGKRAEELASYAVEEYQRHRETMPSIVRKWVQDFLAALKVGLAKALQAAGIGLKLRVKIMADAGVLHKLARDGLRRSAAEVQEQRETAGDAGEPAFSRASPTDTKAFKDWFGDSVVTKNGKAGGVPLVVYHGTAWDIESFDASRRGENVAQDNARRAFVFTDEPGQAGFYAEQAVAIANSLLARAVKSATAEERNMERGGLSRSNEGFARREDGTAVYGPQERLEMAEKTIARGEPSQNILPLYLRINNPRRVDWSRGARNLDGVIAQAIQEGRDGVIVTGIGGTAPNGATLKPGTYFFVFEPEQIKSAIGNRGTFDPTNPDIRYSVAGALASGVNSAKDVSLPAGYKVADLFNGAGKISWWDKTVGTQYNLAQRKPQFKRVYDSVQRFLNDVSYYATEAADLAPNILPKLEGWKDIARSPLSAADTKAVSTPVFEGTLIWARAEGGKAVKVADLEAKAAKMDTEDKAKELERRGYVSANDIAAQRKDVASFDGLQKFQSYIDNQYDDHILRAGVVWSDNELRSIFNLNERQIALYREARAALDKSLTALAISDMLRFGGKDVQALTDEAMAARTPTDAAEMLRDHLKEAAKNNPERADVLNDTGNKIIGKGRRARDLMYRGYAPLSRFGQHTVYVTRGSEQLYFGLFESGIQASMMARKMHAEYPDAKVQQGTVSDEAFKLFAGVSPETLELFGGMLGLEADESGAGNAAFQTYLKLAKSNRSSMKRLIERKGIAGFSEDVGRVLAGFVYSNARQTSGNLHMGEMTDAAASIDKQDGQLKDAAIKLTEYIRNPQEEAHQFRGLLFAQYLGGSVASAMINATQPLAVTFPYLSQFGGIKAAAKQMTAAVRDALKGSTGDKELDAALHKAEEEGIVSPQETHQLMAQAMGKASLKSGDGTFAGNALATGSNVLSKVALAWGKVFGVAEQFNRRVTFIAAYRTAVEQGMADPAAFAEKAVAETQFTYNKGNKPRWARGAIGGTLFTFKTYSVSYVELLARMYRSGPEGKKAALLALAVLFLMAGTDGLPGADDLDDVIDGALQRMGYNFSTKRAKREFFTSVLGEAGAQFVAKGLSGLPGAPLDVSWRMGLGNLIPGTGLLTKKEDHTRDITELLGPAGDLARRGFNAAGSVVDGEFAKAGETLAPVALRNVVKAYDMANTGMYRDDRGRKVLDVDGYEAAVKSIGFQPNTVARVQDASGQVQQMIALNKLRESEIAEKLAQGMFERDQGKVQEARSDLAEWNADNPDSRIAIKTTQILQRVRQMRMSKEERLAKTAPAEIRRQVRRELEATR